MQAKSTDQISSPRHEIAGLNLHFKNSCDTFRLQNLTARGAEKLRGNYMPTL